MAAGFMGILCSNPLDREHQSVSDILGVGRMFLRGGSDPVAQILIKGPKNYIPRHMGVTSYY